MSTPDIAVGVMVTHPGSVGPYTNPVTIVVFSIVKEPLIEADHPAWVVKGVTIKGITREFHIFWHGGWRRSTAMEAITWRLGNE